MTGRRLLPKIGMRYKVLYILAFLLCANSLFLQIESPIITIGDKWYASIRECNLNSVWFLFLLNHNKYNFFFLDLQKLLKVVFGCVQGRRRMSRLYTLAHIRELPFLCV